jgi:hypothetical protein
MPSTATQQRPDLDPETRRRLGLIAGRLGSSFDGERLAALEALDRVLGPRGLRLGDLLMAAATPAPPPPPPPPPPAGDAEARELLRKIDASGWPASTWEKQFLGSIRAWRGRLTEKQRQKLYEIGRRAGAVQ